MTSPQQQPDMGRVVERAAQNISALAVAPLGAQLAMAQEIADLRGAQVVDLERQIAEKDTELEQRDVVLGRAITEKDAELERLRQTNSRLQDRVQQLEAQQGGAGPSPEEGPGEI